MDALIRQLGPDDTAIYAALRREMLVDSPASFGSSPEEDRVAKPEFQIEPITPGGGNVIYGAFAGGLVGAVGLVRIDRLKQLHRAYIWGMYVAPDHRKRGLGRRLMAGVLEYADTFGSVTQVQLSVSESAPGAQHLYASLGFTAWGIEPNALRVDGRGYDEIQMVKMLEGA